MPKLNLSEVALLEGKRTFVHMCVSTQALRGSRAGARYAKSIASLELRHKEHNNDPYSLHNNTIDFTQ